MFVTAALFAAGLATFKSGIAAEPLHVRIDQIVEQSQFGPSAPPATDAEFLRRAYLDFTGKISTSAEARGFLDDPSPDKRIRLIDELLARPEFPRQMAGFFDLMFMERRPDKNVTAEQWQTFLLAAMQRNTSYNQLAAEILSADGLDPRQRAAAKFYLDREVEPNLLTREVGRVFFGVDLECAQCHDHPIVDDYYQSDYYGIFAFVNRTFVFQVDGSRPAVLAEKAEGDVNFKSVFTAVEGSTKPRLMGATQLDEPAINPKAAYQPGYDPNNKAQRPIPAYSRRQELAKRATDGTNKAFNRNIVNRLWAHLMGRGLVHPVDLHHVDNPPSHPELLDLLADEFAATKFDVKNLVRELTLTQAYARSSEMPADLTGHVGAARQKASELEQLAAARSAELDAAHATLTEVRDRLASAREALAALPKELKAATDAAAAAKPLADAAATALAEAQLRLLAMQEPATALAESATKAQAAAAQLAGDSELADIAAKLLAKSQQTATALEALKNEIAQKDAAANATAASLAAAEKSVAECTARQLALPGEIAAADASVFERRAKWQTAAAASHHARTLLKQAQTLLAWSEKQAAAEVAAADAARSEITTQWDRQFLVSPIAALTPEQLAWSIMQAVGIVERQRLASAAELEVKSPLKPEDPAFAELSADRQRRIEEDVHAKLKGNVAQFITMFGGAAGQPQDEFFATVDQALFFGNGGVVQGWLAPGGDNLTERLLKLEDSVALAEETYLSILSRRPSEEESTRAADYLAARPNEKPQAVQEMCWALLSSAEFRFRY